MPLSPRPECGTAVSTTARACPAFGASKKPIARANRPPKKSAGRFGKIAIVGTVLATVAVASISSLHERPPATPVDAMADAMFKRRGEAAVEDAVQLKRSLRDPDSLTFDRIRTNDDGSIVCISYRARNGFGGTNREHMAFIAGLSTVSTTVWNKRCAKAELSDDTTRTVQMIGLLAR